MKYLFKITNGKETPVDRSKDPHATLLTKEEAHIQGDACIKVMGLSSKEYHVEEILYPENPQEAEVISDERYD